MSDSISYYQLHRDEIRANRIARQKRIVRRNKIILGVFIVSVLLVISFFITSYTASAKTDKESYKYYKSITVAPGDTLWSIADTYMTVDYNNRTDYIKEIKEINHIGGDEIHAGESLVICYYSYDYLE